MKTKRIALLTAITLITTQLFASDPANNLLGDESLEVAELIVHLAKGIASDLNRPASGAERIVTNASVTDEGSRRIFFIEGQDVLHNGQVLSTYWVRLIKGISSAEDDKAFYAAEVGPGAAFAPQGRALSPESQELIGPMLNAVYDFATMELDHSKVILDQIVKANDEPLSFEIIGENRICQHTELNTFKIIITRHVVHNRPSYVTELVLPFSDAPAEELLPLVPVR